MTKIKDTDNIVILNTRPHGAKWTRTLSAVTLVDPIHVTSSEKQNNNALPSVSEGTGDDHDAHIYTQLHTYQMH